MEKSKTEKFEMPKLIMMETYSIASFEHCHQVKECDPYAAKA